MSFKISSGLKRQERGPADLSLGLGGKSYSRSSQGIISL